MLTIIPLTNYHTTTIFYCNLILFYSTMH